VNNNGAADFEHERDVKCASGACSKPMVHPSSFIQYRKMLTGTAMGLEGMSLFERDRKIVEASQAANENGVPMQRWGRAQQLGERKDPLRPGLKAGPELNTIITHHLAALTNEELEFEELGKYLAWEATQYTVAPVKWIQGPRKGLRRAYEKTFKDYAFNASQNKDWVRGTVAVKSQFDLERAVKVITETIVWTNGFTLPKASYVPAYEELPDKTVNACGYSGWNGAITISGHRYWAEIQANTFSMLYGKMPKKDFMKCVGYDDSEYKALQKQIGIQGGLHHAMYEIYRTEPDSLEGMAAASLSRDYCAYCRKDDRDRSLAKPLTEQIVAFGKMLADSDNAAAKRRDPTTGRLTSDSMQEIWVKADGPYPWSKVKYERWRHENIIQKMKSEGH
jgi:hypothetical protein